MYVAKAGGFFFIVFGVIVLMAATMTINPVWNYGPYDPSPVSAGAQPDWYMLFLEGALRLMPGQGTEWVIGGFTLSLNVLIPAVVVPGLLFTLLALYPFVEAFVTERQAASTTCSTGPATARSAPRSASRPHGVLHPRARRVERPHRGALLPVAQRPHRLFRFLFFVGPDLRVL